LAGAPDRAGARGRARAGARPDREPDRGPHVRRARRAARERARREPRARSSLRSALGVDFRAAACAAEARRPMDERRRPEDFLELVERSRRGRLKVYIGFAAGVGKTYRMLEEAHALRERGVDGVVGLVETHGREETEALLPGLEIVPRRKVGDRGVTGEERAPAPVLAAKPTVALVDEVAHTNVPGCRNAKRYEDVYELLEAGINVICAFKIQHLESLKEMLQRAL